jgi:hypothetical protein
VWWLFQHGELAPFFRSGISPGANENNLSMMADYYASHFLTPMLVGASSLFSFAIGYLLLRTSGQAARQVIPVQDYPLLSRLLLTGKAVGMDEYVRLSSLTGFVGVFTKVGLSGLPLATIVLTIFFAAFAPFSTTFQEFAKLTLGAFLGSYVQRTASERLASGETKTQSRPGAT